MAARALTACLRMVVYVLLALLVPVLIRAFNPLLVMGFRVQRQQLRLLSGATWHFPVMVRSSRE
jgi:hypothetical protein